ncbi:helix-turn-helix domain-containing protein [Phytoactinopolyspora limicola]|uniref:helix-turn-helix domain-containing protein n=1 Tax=Phytoactinopolyspora limicola TaxID=2715536 RepID=UPI0014076C7A|nr:GAF domain-containing protein [Phytoactinopolyspora limicola]
MGNERSEDGHRDNRRPQAPGSVAATIAGYFDLLLRDTPAVEYERLAIEARSAGSAGADLAAVEDAKLAALKVRTLLHDYRRRESELAALYETANDLAGMRNLDQVLRAIVDRARALLGTDIAYLTLRDTHSEDTTMRVTSGSVSAQFQQVRLAPGQGLGGLVATTSRPYVTANYFTDERFTHTAPIDTAVREEGLVAILGVPLELNGQVIGVLFAANRRERPFVPAEIALLRSLATHAAIAIDAANLIDRTHTALDELNTANAQLRARTEEVERAADAHDKLADLLLRGAAADDITAAVAALLDGQVELVDLADADTSASDDDTLVAAITEALANARVARTGTDHDTWVATAAAGNEPLVALTLRRTTALDAAEQRILERAAVVAALLLLRRRSVSDAEHRVRGELLDEMLDTPRGDPETLRQRARRVATDPEQPYVIVVADAPDADPERLYAAARHIAEVRRGLATRRDGRAVLALPADNPKESVDAVAADLRTAVGVGLTAAAAGPTHGLASFPTVHREAVRCLKALHALGRTGAAAVPADLGFLGVLLGDRHDAAAFVTATIGPLVDYDTERGTALVETLAAYFAAGGSLTRAKDALHVHVNTVAQRLDRVSQLIGAGWTGPDRALELQLALRVHGLLRHGVDLGDDLPDG